MGRVVAFGVVCSMLALAPGAGVAQPAPRLSVTGDGLFLDDREISLETFLRTAGKPERAREVSERKWLRRGLWAGGGTLFAGGALYALTAESCGSLTGDEGRACDQRRSDRHNFGISIGVLGGAVAVMGFVLSSKRPSLQELRRMAEDHNRDLELTPTVGDGGGGVSLRARF